MAKHKHNSAHSQKSKKKKIVPNNGCFGNKPISVSIPSWFAPTYVEHKLNPTPKPSFYGGIDWAAAHAMYENHFNSNPYITGQRELLYTFFADMAVTGLYKTKDEYLAYLKSYVARMLNQYCKNNAVAYEVMIDSLNLLGWWFYEKHGRDEITDFLFGEYERLFCTDAYLNYVSHEQMKVVYSNLN